MYIYDYQLNVIERRSGSGDAVFQTEGPFLLREEQWYTIDMHIHAGTPMQTDGYMEMYIDGVLTHYRTGRVLRGDEQTRINMEWFEMLNGSTGAPIGPISYGFAANVLSTQYVGPPKKIT
jgi:hypothetical protein